MSSSPALVRFLAGAVVGSVFALSGCGKSGDDHAATGGSNAAEGGKGSNDGGKGSGAAGKPNGAAGKPASNGGSGNTPVEGDCAVDGILKSLGKDKLLLGGAMEDATAKLAPFDVRYLYLSGAFPDGDKPCTSCATGCATSGKTCANSGGGCQWWGCWQFDQDPPGAYMRDFVKTAKANGQIPMASLYIMLQATKVKEGPAEVTAANDPAVMVRYFDQFHFLLDQIGNDVALIHIEPDFWGYAQQINPDPSKIPAAVSKANPTDCKDLPDTIAGMGNCLVAMTRAYAPNAKIGLHASGWGTKNDVLHNSDPKTDVEGIGKATGEFMGACATDADFLVIDAADRDAAWYDTQNRSTWWDDTNAKLPNFTQAFTWAKAVSLAAKKPVFWWQVPLGNMTLPNKDGQWKDNRLDYFLDHLDEVAAAQAFGVVFGAGAGGQTTFETDGGHAVSKIKSIAEKGGQAPCP